ncbi:hypothetical protein VT06_12835 [Arsukibacterium sp. MJ3]|uniref:GGDEF domain-containing phosphodiesterase n=1 Tax=Arsukibacterium sp. MJ3 TaxID=1632859 RepID=UPI0006271B49|nr:GGDEF domain-containing phosphodiesterase [Arsukibacterium sp. MJ3]KKO48272.1 hypothetical protein VT06_12835 [Arsukibacterium sp. MJ3]
MKKTITQETIVDVLSETLIVVNSNGVIEWVNQAVNTLLGYRREELVGMPLSILIPPEFCESHNMLFKGFQHQSSKQAMGYSRPLFIMSKKNERKAVFIELTPVNFQNEKCVLATVSENNLTTQYERIIDDVKNLFNESQSIANIGAWDWNILTGELHWSTQIFVIFGLKENTFNVSYENFISFVHHEDRDAVESAVKKTLSGDAPYSVAHRIVRLDQSLRYVVERGKVYRDAAGKPIRMIGTVQDITLEHNYQMQLRVADSIFQYSYDGAISTDNYFKIIKANPSFERMSGYTAFSLEGISLFKIIPELGEKENLESINSKGYWQGRITCKNKKNEIFPVQLSIVKVDNEIKFGVKFYIVTINDISNITAHEAQLKKLAYFDPLTSLYNRSYFIERMSEEIAHCISSKDEKCSMSLLFIDLDGFKEVNDSQGHDEGDRILSTIARLLDNVVENEMLLSRFGGDEFVILYKSGVEVLVQKLASKISQALSIVLVYGSQDFKITASIGIAIFPKDGTEAQDLLKKADIAMYKAKESGKNRFLFYKEEFSKQKAHRRQLVSDLERGISEGHIVAYFQQIIPSEKDEVYRFEALARWFHPQKGVISPVEFIPIAEETGLIAELGSIVLKQAIDFLEHWYLKNTSRAVISVNLSAYQLFEPSLLERILNIVGTNPILYKSLIFEITESAIMQNFDTARITLSGIKALGCSIALDDFGTGYSSLSYLSRLPIDEVKIDKSFINKLPENESDCLICKAIVSLSHSLKMKVVAEGVENLNQRQYLKSINCDFMQGFLFSKPMPADEIFKSINAGSIKSDAIQRKDFISAQIENKILR